MRNKIITGVSLVALTAGMAQAGGFELQTLDTSAMYQSGGYASFSTAQINSDLGGQVGNGPKTKTLRDQSITNFALKSDVGVVGVGLSSYRSGAIQMSGENDYATTYAPSADADLDSMTLMANYSLSDEISILGGITQNNLKAFTLNTLASGAVGTPYQINSGTSTGYVIGAAYSIPDIALRAELLYQPSSALTTDGTFAGAALTASIKRPETLTLNFQTGIAEGTLLTASVHNAKWSAAPVTVDTVVDVADINETFDDSTKYSVGLARKLSNKWAISAGYSREEGGGSEASSLFTLSNGSQAFSLGARYTLSENMDISFGVSHSIFGDVTVNNVGARTAIAQAGYDLTNGAGSFAAADAATQAAVLGTINPINYENNTATTLGVKLGISF